MQIRATLLVGLILAATITLHGQVQQAAQSDPRVIKGDSMFLAGDFRGALKQYSVAAAAMQLDNRSRYRYAMSLANNGEYAKAAPILDQLAPNGNPAVIYNAGSVYAQLGRADTAFAYLNMAMTAGFSNGQIFAADPGYAKLKTDARYATAERRLRDAFAPCVNSPDSHKFDFWVGEWSVTNPQGQTAGSSSVQKILSDCVVLENWTDLQGGQGKSFNAFNRPLGQWQQYWVDQYGNVTEYRESEWVGKNLQYTARGKNRQGADIVIRMLFEPIDENTVRQSGQTSTDGGKTWNPGYSLTYRRKK